MTYNLVLPHKTVLRKWLDLDRNLKPYYPVCKNLIVDFKYLIFLEPNHLVILACSLEQFYRNNCQISFINLHPKLKRYLEDVNYMQYFSCNNTRPKFTDTKINTSIPIWNIQRNEISSYSLFAKDFFTNNFFKTRDLLILQSNLEEVFNNIFDHSHSPINGFITTQFFPRKNQILCSICDVGTGIADKVNKDKKEKNQPLVDDSKAIEIATTEGYSTRSTPQNRGLGLYYILNIPKFEQGKVSIWANNGSYHNYMNQTLTSETGYSFSGTLINITIDTNTLDERDDDEDEYKF